MRSTSVNVPKLLMSTIEPDAIVAPLSTPLLASISPPARVCSLPPKITAPPLSATCAPLPEAKIVPVLVLLMLAASMSVPPVVASSLPALIVLALRTSVETVLALMVPLLTTVRPPAMVPPPAIVLLTLLKIAPPESASVPLC